VEEIIDIMAGKDIIIFLMFNEDQSQRQIAEQLNISQMKVSRIQKKALIKLKALLIDKHLSAFLD